MGRKIGYQGGGQPFDERGVANLGPDWKPGELRGARSFEPVPREQRHVHIRTPIGALLHTRHQRRFRAYLKGEPLEGGTIAAGSMAWAVDVAREMGADEIRVEREYHNQ
jgi:hypothetical protein